MSAPKLPSSSSCMSHTPCSDIESITNTTVVEHVVKPLSSYSFCPPNPSGTSTDIPKTYQSPTLPNTSPVKPTNTPTCLAITYVESALSKLSVKRKEGPLADPPPSTKRPKPTNNPQQPLSSTTRPLKSNQQQQSRHFLSKRPHNSKDSLSSE